VDVKFVLLDDAHHRLLIGVAGNRIITVNWLKVRDPVHRIKQEDINVQQDWSIYSFELW
jgi:hypothetical protein